MHHWFWGKNKKDLWKKVDYNQSPRGILAKFTALNTESDFSYSYARFTIYCDLSDDGVDINYITKGPFGDKIGLTEIDENIREKMIDDINSRLKKGKNGMSVKKKKAFRNLRIEIRKSIPEEEDPKTSPRGFLSSEVKGDGVVFKSSFGTSFNYIDNYNSFQASGVFSFPNMLQYIYNGKRTSLEDIPNHKLQEIRDNLINFLEDHKRDLKNNRQIVEIILENIDGDSTSIQ